MIWSRIQDEVRRKWEDAEQQRRDAMIRMLAIRQHRAFYGLVSVKTGRHYWPKGVRLAEEDMA